MKEAQKYTIVKALYFIGDTHPKEDARQATFWGPSMPIQGTSKRLRPNKGKKSMFD